MAVRSVFVLVFAILVRVPVIHADVSERFQLDIKLHIDPSITTKRIADVLKSETANIWRPYGVELHWTDGAEPSASGASLEVMVVRRFEGIPPAWPAVLGRAVVTPEALDHRPIRLSLEATKTVLTHRTFTDGPSTGGIVADHDLARALARVLAHEIGHVLLGVSQHDLQGLMRANFTPDELAKADGESFRLSCGSANRVEGRLHALANLTTSTEQARAPLDGDDRRKAPERSDRGACIPGRSR